MSTTILKCSAILALIGLIFLGRSSDSRTLLTSFVVCAAAVLAIIQAIRTRSYVWMSLFFVVAVLFNPVVSVMLSRSYPVVNVISLSVFFLSFWMVPAPPRMSMASITDRTPGSESL